MYNFWTFIIVVLVGLCGFMIGGYLIHKLYPEETPTWEDGVKFLLHLTFRGIKGIFRFAYQEIEGKDLQEYIVDPALILTNQEMADLAEALKGHPYDTPVLADYVQNMNGITWIDIQAVGLVPQYEGISNEQIAKISWNVIEMFFMKTRGYQATVYIKVATPTRLYFAIALSEEGRRRLESQGASAVRVETYPDPNGPLTETVPERWSHEEEQE